MQLVAMRRGLGQTLCQFVFLHLHHTNSVPDEIGIVSWSRLSEQNLRVDKWSLCRG